MTLLIWFACAAGAGLAVHWIRRPFAYGLMIAALVAAGLFALVREADVISFGICVLVAIDYIHDYNQIVSERRKQNGSEC